VEAIIHGGGQQYGIRPGTENVAGAVALGCAARLRRPNRRLNSRVSRPSGINWRQWCGATCRPDGRRCQRHARPAHPHVAIAGADSETLLMHLDMQGVAASGIRLLHRAVEPSHVLSAMGVPRDMALRPVALLLRPREHGRRCGARRGRAQGLARARKLAGALGRA
jgi:cysteine desulfurase